MTSPSSGNLPSFALEKISVPSISISNTPPEDTISSDARLHRLSSSAAKLTARALYPQAPQYVIRTFVSVLEAILVSFVFIA